MPLVDRSLEFQTLETIFASPQAEFLALYGRRRVGKTYLIKSFFEKKNVAFFHVTGIKDGNLSEQISRFTKAISDTFLKGTAIKDEKTWIKAFDSLQQTINNHADKKKKIVLFMDEFPWMATHKSKLLSALDHFWNQYWSFDPRIKLIICGSSASWIIKKIINNKAGLHNRVTQKILLKPFTLAQTKAYFRSNKINLNNFQISQIYMCTGGVPFYLRSITKGQSAAQAIESLAFSQTAPLLTEFDNLISSLFENAPPYIELLNIVSKHRYGITTTEIIKQSKHFSKGGRISEKLKELAQAGFILSFKPGKNKRKGLVHRVIDEYTLFYFHWIEPIRNTLQEHSLTAGYWQELQTSSGWHSWAGYAFEAMVFKHITQVRKALNLPPTAIADTWNYTPLKNSDVDGAQIDLLFHRRDNAITLCEIKFSANQFHIEKQYARELMKKTDIYIKHTKTKKQIFWTIISANGLVNNIYAEDLIDHVVTLDDLFEN